MAETKPLISLKWEPKLPGLSLDLKTGSSSNTCLWTSKSELVDGLCLPPNDPNKINKMIRKQLKDTTGSNWFVMPAPTMTPELKRDLQLLKDLACSTHSASLLESSGTDHATHIYGSTAKLCEKIWYSARSKLCDFLLLNHSCSEEAKSIAAAASSRGKIEITEIKDFAGQEIEVKRLVETDSKQALDRLLLLGGTVGG